MACLAECCGKRRKGECRLKQGLASAGVVFFQFRRIRSQYEIGENVSAEQQQWMTVVKYMLSLKFTRQIPKPKQAWRKLFHKLALSTPVETIIMVVIVLNVIEMCVWWYGQTGSIVKFKENLNLAFSIIFMVCTHSCALTHLLSILDLVMPVLPALAV